MNMSRIAAPAGALVVGIVLGAYCASPSVPEPKPEPNAADKVVKSVKDAAKEAVVSALRKRIAELERQLKDKGAADAAAAAEQEQKTEEESPRAGRRGRHGPPDMAEMRKAMEEFKRDHPEEYAEREKRRQEFMQRMKRREQENMAFLAEIDTSGMSEAERELHSGYQKLLGRRGELREKIGSQDISDEERGQAFRDLMDVEREIRDSSGQMRENLIKLTAEALGFVGEEVGEISGTIQAILDATESGGGHGRGPGPAGAMQPPSAPPEGVTGAR